MKACAYAKAIDQFCFPTYLFSTDDLRRMSIKEEAAFPQEETASDVLEIAFKHLGGDQSACAPAIAFVQRIVSTVSTSEPELDRVITLEKDGIAAATLRAQQEAIAAAQAQVAADKRKGAAFDEQLCRAAIEAVNERLDKGISYLAEYPKRLNQCLSGMPEPIVLGARKALQRLTKLGSNRRDLVR